MRNEDERNDYNDNNDHRDNHSRSSGPKKINIIEERLVVNKEKVEKGSVRLHKRVIEEDVPLDLELTEEHIDVEVKRIGEVVDKPGPAVREEGDTKIYSVYREVYVKQTILEEEVRITRKKSTKPFHTSETLRREVIDVERFSGRRDSGSQGDRDQDRDRRDRDSDRDRNRDEFRDSDQDREREDRKRAGDRNQGFSGDDRENRSSGNSLQGEDPGYNRQGDLSGYDQLKE